MNGERGFTLVEMLVSIVITGAIALVLGMVVQQMVSVPEKSSDQVAALHDLQNTAHWLGIDVLAAESASIAGNGDSLNLTLPDTSVIRYLRSGDTLYRYDNGGYITLARNITSMDFTVDDRLITVDITAAPDSRWDISENRIYQIAMRPTGT